ncbi:MAG: flap endonuclease-1 [Euryarchaeota archaeon RBG_13_61_15]|nr:MAG: flap endonuclease-1 [Euryarchaeota archaeon RBG_13_61_15]
MGVDISGLVEAKPLALEDLSGRSIAIDAFNTLYQFLANIRQPDGTPLMDRDGRVTSHLSGLFHRTTALLELGIRPAYVFDGAPPELKRKTLEARRAVKVQAEKDWKEALDRGDLKTALSKASRTSRLDAEMISEAQTLLDAMGVPWMTAPAEGEAQMGHMARRGDVWAGASQDFDAILFGTPTLVRNLTLAGKRRLPSGKTVDVTPEVVSLSDVLGALQVSRAQLVDMGILMGTDFNEGVRGIGPKKSLAIIRRLGSLEEVAREGKVAVPAEFADVRRIFLEPEVSDEYVLSWRGVDEEAVRRIMCDRHSFSVDRIDSVLARLRARKGSSDQRSLDSWG